jgi:CheY-like chemotaxis protein
MSPSSVIGAVFGAGGEEAQNGNDRLRKVTCDHFALALIGINMPVMDA